MVHENKILAIVQLHTVLHHCVQSSSHKCHHLLPMHYFNHFYAHTTVVSNCIASIHNSPPTHVCIL